MSPPVHPRPPRQQPVFSCQHAWLVRCECSTGHFSLWTTSHPRWSRPDVSLTCPNLIDGPLAEPNAGPSQPMPYSPSLRLRGILVTRVKRTSVVYENIGKGYLN